MYQYAISGRLRAFPANIIYNGVYSYTLRATHHSATHCTTQVHSATHCATQVHSATHYATGWGANQRVHVSSTVWYDGYESATG